MFHFNHRSASVVISRDLGSNPFRQIHLHGHDVYILRQGEGLFLNHYSLNTQNPPRRDTAQLPAGGHVVLAFKTDNPGAWLLHCHIAFHLHHGFARVVIERPGEIAGVYGNGGTAEMNRVCANWDASGLENRE